MRTEMLLLTLLHVACTGTPDPAGDKADADTAADADTDTDTDTDADTAADTDTDTVTPVLDDGTYIATTLGFTTETCGDLAIGLQLAAANVRIQFTSGTTFDATYRGGVGYSCEVDGEGAVTCGGYEQSAPISGTATLLIGVSVVDFVVTSFTSFDQAEVLDLDCSGDGCAEFAAAYGAAFPCSLRVDERFAL